MIPLMCMLLYFRTKVSSQWLLVMILVRTCLNNITSQSAFCPIYVKKTKDRLWPSVTSFSLWWYSWKKHSAVIIIYNEFHKHHSSSLHNRTKVTHDVKEAWAVIDTAWPVYKINKCLCLFCDTYSWCAVSRGTKRTIYAGAILIDPFHRCYDLTLLMQHVLF